MKALTGQFEDWVATKPPEERYDFTRSNVCAYAQFGDHVGLPLRDKRSEEIPERLLNALVKQPWTFGALRERLRDGRTD